ncbi:MAG: hypothetical protein HQ541_15940 [Mariniphaga sp.]|nr:hypothetical protein [Mariniphaga sp.]
MKRFFGKIIAAILGIALISCNVDEGGYSITNMWVSFGIFQEDENANLGYSIKLDNNDLIIPMSSDIYLGQYDDSSRVIVNYTVLGDISDTLDYNQYYVKINSMRDILKKGILDITPAIEDSIGNDPIIVKDAWLSGNLLTFELKYWGDHKVHYINLIKQPGELLLDNEPIALELRHNDNGDSHHLPYVAYVSFDLLALKIKGADSTRFTVTATDYSDEIYSEDGVYIYGDN